MRSVALVLCLTGIASAESPYWVDAKLDGQTVTMNVRLKLPVKRGAHNEYSFDLPGGAVITRATAHADGQAHPLALTEKKEVDASWDSLTEPGNPGPHPPWVVKLDTDANIAVAAPHAGELVLDLELQAGTCFTADRRYVELPESWLSSTDKSLRVQSVLEHTCASGAAHALWWPVTDAKTAAERTFTHAQSLTTQHGQLAHVEVDLAAKLSTVPDDLATVFLVDASRSIDDNGLRAMQQVIESYVHHAPRSQLQIVAYARKARALLPAWMTARRALPKIAREMTSLELANGSNADAGLVEAAAWLKSISGTRRVVLFTDTLVPDRVASIAETRLKDLLPGATLVHVVSIGKTATHAALERDDSQIFAQLAALTEGWSGHAVTVVGDQCFDATELVRPIAIDRFALQTSDWTNKRWLTGTDCKDPLLAEHVLEGSSCTWSGTAAAGGTITIDGLVWNHPIHRVVELSNEPRTLARLLTGLHEDLGDATEDVRKIADALNESWSAIAVWGGRDHFGPEEDGRGYLMGSSCGCDGPPGYGFAGHAYAGTLRTNRDVEAQVAAAI
ncbi:MAG TPA: vWA domain-containing protein, partial [Kofleriaceae bacterium]